MGDGAEATLAEDRRAGRHVLTVADSSKGAREAQVLFALIGGSDHD
ncbi:hypothetical protein [Paenibacillus guangzhouensis]|nr:hypothetical protein [Paenibacillus guangzhouensis]